MSPLSWWFDYWAGAFDTYMSHLGLCNLVVPAGERAREQVPD